MIERAVRTAALGLIMSAAPTWVAAGTLRFGHLTVDDGLSQSWVRTIVKDSRGFIWIGTQNGLNRYDGTGFTIYRSDPEDPRSLSSSTVRGLLEDGKGRVWVATGAGLCRYVRAREDFERVSAGRRQPVAARARRGSLGCPVDRHGRRPRQLRPRDRRLRPHAGEPRRPDGAQRERPVGRAGRSPRRAVGEHDRGGRRPLRSAHEAGGPPHLLPRGTRSGQRHRRGLRPLGGPGGPAVGVDAGRRTGADRSEDERRRPLPSRSGRPGEPRDVAGTLRPRRRPRHGLRREPRTADSTSSTSPRAASATTSPTRRSRTPSTAARSTRSCSTTRASSGSARTTGASTSCLPWASASGSGARGPRASATSTSPPSWRTGAGTSGSARTGAVSTAGSVGPAASP